MPRIFQVGDTVRVINRVSNDDPPRGAVGIVVRAGAHENDYFAVDYAEFVRQNPAGGGTYDGLHNLDGLIPRETGRNHRGQNLELILAAPPVAEPVTAQPRRESRADHLVGLTVQFRQNYGDPSLRGMVGEIIAISGGAGRANSLCLRIPAFTGGHTCGGYLPPDSTEGWYLTAGNWEDVDIVVPSAAEAPIGMEFVVRDPYQEAREGQTGIIVYPKGQPRPNDHVDQRRHGVRLYGFPGHDHATMLPRRPGVAMSEGYNVIPDAMLCDRRITIRQLLTNMAGEPGIALRFPEHTTDTPLLLAQVQPVQPDWPIGTSVYLRDGRGMVPTGLCGVITQIGQLGGQTTYTVEFPREEFPAGNYGGYATAFDRVPDTLPTNTVVVRNALQEEGYNHYPTGARGRICTIDDGDYGVDMDDVNDASGDCNGAARENHGYWLRRAMFDVLYIPPVPGAGRRGRPAPSFRLRDMQNPFDAPGGGRGLNPDNIGRAITLVHRDDYLKAMGVPLNATGRIVGVHGSQYTVDFTPMVLRDGHNGHGNGFGEHSCWDCNPGWLQIGDRVENQSQSLAKGDRVTLVFGGSSMPPKDTEGVVLRVKDGAVEVDFYPYRWKYGRQLSGGNDRSCATMPAYYLKKVEIAEVEKLKPFFIIGVIDKKVVPLEGHPTFETGTEAEAYKKKIEGDFPYKIQVRKAAKPDSNWREREKARFTDGTYRPLPKGWDLQPIVDHFLHLSVKHPGQVAFTPNEDYGQQDRQTNTRPGAYVQKFYPHLDNKQVARYSALAACDGGLEIVNDGKEMARIYMLGAEGMGPESCMKYDFVRSGHGGAKTPIHPIECYDAGDIALAYLRQDGAIVARCLIWPERKLFTRAYGDLAKIIAILEAEGYSRGDFTGAKLRRVTFDYGGTRFWVCPYVDESNSVLGNPGAMGVVDDGTHLIITKPSEGQSTNQAMGYIRIDRRFRTKDAAGAVACGSCKNLFDADELRTVAVGYDRERSALIREQWCTKCVGSRSFVCTGFGERCSNKTMVRVPNEKSSGYYSKIFIEETSGFVCELTGRGYPHKRPILLEDGRKVGEDGFRNLGFTCAGTQKKYSKDHPETGERQYLRAGGKFFHVQYATDNPEVIKAANEEEERRRKLHEEKLKAMKGKVGAGLQYTTNITSGDAYASYASKSTHGLKIKTNTAVTIDDLLAPPVEWARPARDEG